MLRTLLAAGVVVAVTLILIGAVETCFYCLNHGHQQDIVMEGDILKRNFFMRNDALGYKPQPSMRVSSIRKANGATIYSAVYTTDAHGRRLTPQPRLSEPPKRFALFFGCSYTFGEGLNDNETLPLFFSRSAPLYRAYNYGLSGYGPQQMLEHLKRQAMAEEISEQHGIGVYTFMDHHVKRVIGAMRSYSLWADIMPYYYLNGQNSLIRNGCFKTGRPVLNRLYWLLNKSQVVQYFNLDLPRINENHFKLTARILEESAVLFNKKFPGSQLYILFYPGSRWSTRIKPYLERAGIKSIDYSQLFDPQQPEYHIAGDIHPSPQALSVLAEKLSADIAFFPKSK